jgi:hypothetical protein
MTDHERGIEAAMEAGLPKGIRDRRSHRERVEDSISAYIEAGGFDSVHASTPVAEAVKVKSLEWREDWGGSLEVIPEWRAKTPWGMITVSVAGHRDDGGNRYERHSDVPEDLKTQLIGRAQADFERRIMSALSTPPQPEAKGDNPEEPVEGEYKEAMKRLYSRLAHEGGGNFAIDIIMDVERIVAIASHPCTSTPVVSQNATGLEGNGGDGQLRFSRCDLVRKKSGSSWNGRVVGFYSTELTPIGYCVESEREPGSVQIYPEAALVPAADPYDWPMGDGSNEGAK